jgi:hypothetical protein
MDDRERERNLNLCRGHCRYVIFRTLNHGLPASCYAPQRRHPVVVNVSYSS